MERMMFMIFTFSIDKNEVNDGVVLSYILFPTLRMKRKTRVIILQRDVTMLNVKPCYIAQRIGCKLQIIDCLYDIRQVEELFPTQMN